MKHNLTLIPTIRKIITLDVIITVRTKGIKLNVFQQSCNKKLNKYRLPHGGGWYLDFFCLMFLFWKQEKNHLLDS